MDSQNKRFTPLHTGRGTEIILISDVILLLSLVSLSSLIMINARFSFLALFSLPGPSFHGLKRNSPLNVATFKIHGAKSS